MAYLEAQKGYPIVYRFRHGCFYHIQHDSTWHLLRFECQGWRVNAHYSRKNKMYTFTRMAEDKNPSPKTDPVMVIP